MSQHGASGSRDARRRDEARLFSSSMHGGSSPMVFPGSDLPSSAVDPGASPMRQPNLSSTIGQTPPLTMTDFLPSSSSAPHGFGGAGFLSSQADPSQPGRARRPRRHDLGDAAEWATDALSDEMDGAPAAGPSTTNAPLPADPIEKVRVIWGTNIVIKDAMAQFREFLQHFAPAHRALSDEAEAEAAAGAAPSLPATAGPSAADTATQEPAAARTATSDRARDFEPYYPRLLRQIRDMELGFLNLDAQNLRTYSPTRRLYTQLLAHPQEIIPLMDIVANEVYATLFGSSGAEPIQVRPFNLGISVNLRTLGPRDVDTLVTIKGLVIRASSIMPDMRTAFFRCSACEAPLSVDNVKGKIGEPARCSHCRAEGTLVLVHNRCLFSDKQLVKVQETPDAVPDGQTPHAVTVCVYDALVDAARAGDRVEITGIFRVAQVRVSPRQRRVRAVFRTYLDAVHVRRCEADTRLAVAVDGLATTEHLAALGDLAADGLATERALADADLVALSRRPDLYAALAASVAPSIYQLDTVKKSLLLQLFGGVSKTLARYGNARFRGDINVLLAGDPSVSKSQLLKYVNGLAPRGIYTSGKGSSAVGLTAYITRDPETRQLVLESGALVLSDGGLCCIDEFDKMSDATRAILHEVMEQQTVSVAKAGIITTLNARTAVLAAANPIDSKYNASKSIVENLALPPSLLSRFDIIALVLDRADEAADLALARHIAALHLAPSARVTPAAAAPVPPRTLARYISYARTHVSPVLDDSAIRPLAEGYVAMRRVNGLEGGAGKTVSATTRQLESLIRLAEAHARMRLSPIVTDVDVQEAIRLVRTAILSYALDPVTGRIDMDLVTTGRSAAARERAADLRRAVQAHLSGRGVAHIDLATLLRELNANASLPVSERQLVDVLRDLNEEGFLSVALPLRPTSVIHRVL